MIQLTPSILKRCLLPQTIAGADGIPHTERESLFDSEYQITNALYLFAVPNAPMHDSAIVIVFVGSVLGACRRVCDELELKWQLAKLVLRLVVTQMGVMVLRTA